MAPAMIRMLRLGLESFTTLQTTLKLKQLHNDTLSGRKKKFPIFPVARNLTFHWLFPVEDRTECFTHLTFGSIFYRIGGEQSPPSFLSLNYWTILKIEYRSHAKQQSLTVCLCVAVPYMLLFLVLAVNSARFRILHSYTLLLKLPILMHFWTTTLQVADWVGSR